MYGKKRFDMIGDKNPVKRPEVAKKISEKLKGRKITWGDKISKAKKGKCTGDKNPIYGRKGEKAPNWQGGKSFEPYGAYWTEEYKAAIRQRDNFTCQLCGKYPAFDVHHIDYDKKNPDPEMKIVLCRGCNVKVNFNRDYWKNYFLQKINEKNRQTL